MNTLKPGGVEERWLEIDGTRVRFLAAGEGPPLVLIHGATADADDWLKLIPGLARHFRVLAPDMAGFGLSYPRKAKYTMDMFANNLETFLEREAPGPVNMAGHSLGGRLALEIALKRPARLRRLILVNSVGVGKVGPGGGLLLSLFIGARKALRKPYPYPTFDESIEDPYLRIPERLPSIRTPTLLLWGALDPYYPLGQGKEAQKLIPGAKLVVIKGCGHSPCKEQPGEVLKQMLEFLATSP
jgi:pimeloyl-ACP methyl ester carboxylesterase